MKKLLLILFILIGIFAEAQLRPRFNLVGTGINGWLPVPGYTTINSRYYWLGGAFSAFNLPSGTTPAFATGQWRRSGALFYDSTGGNKGVHYSDGTNWIRLYDTADVITAATPTFQQTLTAGNTLTGDNTVNLSSGNLSFNSAAQVAINTTSGRSNFTAQDAEVSMYNSSVTYDSSTSLTMRGGFGGATFVEIKSSRSAGAVNSKLLVYPDSMTLAATTGFYRFSAVPSSIDTTTYKPFGVGASGIVRRMNSWAQVSGGGGSGLTVGTTPITSGTGGRILYETSGNVLGETTTTSTGSNLLVNTTSATDPITGNAIFKAADANGMVLSFRDHVSGQGYLAISNGTMTGYLGQTNATQGITTGSYTAHPVTIVQQNSPAMTFDVSKHVGVYTVTSPSALFHLPAGSASATYAPLKFTTGTLNTTAEAGTKEYNGTHYATKASGLRYASEGTIADFYTDVNNSGTGETDIYTYTTPASTLANDGEKVFFNYTLNLADITATATIKCYFAGTAIANTGALTVSATGAVIVTGWIVRTSSTTARASVNIASPTASTAVYTSQTDLTGLTLSGTNIVKVTAQAGGGTGGSNDIVGKSGTVSWRGVAAN